MPTMEMYCPSSKTKVQATIIRGEYVTSKGGSKRRVLYGEYNGKKCLPKTVKAEVFAKYGFSAEESLVGSPSPSSPLDDAPALVPTPAEPSNANFSADAQPCPECKTASDYICDFCAQCKRCCETSYGCYDIALCNDCDGSFIGKDIDGCCGSCDDCCECKNAESFEAESAFDKLEDEVAEEYEEKGMSDEEADKIGAAVAYKQGVKKYGKKVMTEAAKKGVSAKSLTKAESYSADGEEDCDVCGIIKPLNAEGYCSECSHKSEYFNALSEDSYIVTKSARLIDLPQGMTSTKFRHKETGEIATRIPISEMRKWEKMNAESFKAEFEGELCDNCDGKIQEGFGFTIPPHHSPHTMWCESCYENKFEAESFNAERIELQGIDSPEYEWDNLYYNCPTCNEELSIMGGKGGTSAICENGCDTEYPRNMLANFDEWHWFHNGGASENARNDYKEPKESDGIPVCGICDFSQSYSPDNMVELDEGSWKCQGCGEITESFSAESNGLSKPAQTAIGLTALGIGMALWKSEWINKLFDRK